MKNMTKGNIRKHIIIFSYPLLISNILIVTNLFVNRLWAGKFLGKDAISAITISSAILCIAFSLATGFTLATSTIISQYFGSGKEKKISITVANSFIVIVIISLLMTISMIFSAKPILTLMNTPYEILEIAKNYLLITSIGFPFLFCQILISYFFRAIGNSKIPLVFSSISVIINLLLDPFLMLGIAPFPRLGVTGAAFALLISQLIAFVIALYCLQTKGGNISIKGENFLFDAEIIKHILRLGIPAAIQSIAVALGMAVTQFFINDFGTNAIAAFSVINIISYLLLYFAWSISAGISVITGQNIGIEAYDRAKETLSEGVKICLLFVSIIIIIGFCFPKIYLLIFLKDSAINAISIGIEGIRILGIPFLFFVSIIIFNSFLNGAGDTFSAMIITVIGMWGLRIPLIWFMSNIFGVTGVWIGLGCSWILSAILSYLYYLTGNWKHKKITNVTKSSFTT